jgi:anti-sigma factor RsiW
MNCDLCQEKLDAYVDESLPAEELGAVDDHLRDCQSCASEALARLQMKRATRAAAARFSPSPEFRLRMEKTIRKRRPQIARISWLPWLSAAACALLLIVVSATLLTRRATRQQALAELLDQHVATLASANPVDVVSTDRHTVKPWFQGKLPFTFNLPELQDSQFTLTGGKLIYFNNSPGAQLLFELRKHRLSVFIVQEQPGGLPLWTGARQTTEKGFSEETWTESGLRYVVISDAGSGDVHALGDLLRSAGSKN